MSIPATDGFIDTLRLGAMTVVADLTLYEYTAEGAITQQVQLPVSTANITNDRNSAIRRAGSIAVELVPSIPPPSLLPTGFPTAANPQLLAPFGNEVAIALGLATGSANSGPVAQVTGSINQGSDYMQVVDLTGQGLQFTIGDTVWVRSVPFIVGNITAAGANTYDVWPIGGVPVNVMAGDPVQLVSFVNMGLFTITSTVIDATAPDLTITLDVSDRAFVIDARQITSPYKFPATESATFEAEVEALLNMAWGTYPNLPPLVFNFSDCNNPIVPTASYNQGSSPWQMALDLALVAGNELYFDENGIVTAHVYPNVQTKGVSYFFTDSDVFANPSKSIASGSPYQVPVGVQVTFTREGIYNDVYITGSGTQNAPGVSTSSSTATGGGLSTSTSSASPVLGHAADNSPGSATYVQGPLGDLPEFVSSNLLPTASQAQAMASLDLAMSKSSAWQVEITTQPNPLIDVDDIISVNYPSVGLNGPATTTPTDATLEGSIAAGSPGIQVTVSAGGLPFVVGDSIIVGTSLTPVEVIGISQVGANSWQVAISPGLPSNQSASATIYLVTGYQGVCVVVDTITTGVKYAETSQITGRVVAGRYA